jgi:hypothetical protein
VDPVVSVDPVFLQRPVVGVVVVDDQDVSVAELEGPTRLVDDQKQGNQVSKDCRALQIAWFRLIVVMTPCAQLPKLLISDEVEGRGRFSEKTVAEDSALAEGFLLDQVTSL